MKQSVTIAAAIYLLTSAAAFAQTEPSMPDATMAPPPDLQSTPQNIEIPPPPAAEPGFDAPGGTAEAEAAGDDDRGRARREWRRGRLVREDGGRGRRGMGHGMMGRGMGPYGAGHDGWRAFEDAGSRGARFTFSQGDGSPSVVIKCADEDSTLECANAVMPMLDRFLPPQTTGAATP